MVPRPFQGPGGRLPRWTLVVGMFDVLATLAALAVAFQPVSLHGTVVDAAGDAVDGARVSVLGSSKPAKTLTGPTGRFTIGGLRKGARPSLEIVAPGFMPVTAAPGTVVLRRLPTLDGRLEDDTGAPLGDAAVTVTVPGRPIEWTVTSDPAGRFRLPGPVFPGAVLVEVESPSHDPARQVLRLVPDQRATVHAVLRRQMATLELSSTPPGLVPLVDGIPATACPATPCHVVVPVGEHSVHMEADLYVPWDQRFTTLKGDRVALAPVLERKRGTLSIQAPAAPDATLTLDGNPISGTSWTGLLPTGIHRVSYDSGAFWPYEATVQVAWNQTTAFTAAPTAVSTDPAAFADGLRQYLASLGGRYGVYLEEMKSGRSIGVGDGDGLEAASVIKVPVALALLHQVEARKVRLEDEVELKDEDFMSGTGTLYGTAHAGDKIQNGQLLALLIQQSDNTAWRALDRELGKDSVDAYAASAGAPDCRQDSDLCTAREAGVLIASLARGRLLNPANTALLLQLLGSTAFNDRINYYLGGIGVAHKVGMDGGVINDSGIVYLPGNPFVMSMFTTTDDPDRGVHAIRIVARAAAHLYAAG